MESIKEQVKQSAPAPVLVDYKTLYAEIELTPEEVDFALYEVRKKKAAIIKENAYWDKVRESSKPLVLTNDALQRYAMWVSKRTNGIDFIVDEHNETIFNLLTLYFNNDPMFETAGYSLKKGLMLYGGVGCGKTTMLKMFSCNPKGSYIFTSCNTIAASFSKDGYEGIKKYFTPAVQGTDTFGHKNMGIFFDDLGTEKNKKHFGNEANVMEEIILNWYDAFNRSPERIHISTNLTVADIEASYGTRVRSRMREMFNVFEFSVTAPDRRK